MKKLNLFLLLITITFRLSAQTVTFTTVTPPCDSNGVIVATFTGLTLPVVVYWYTSSTGSVYDTVATGTTDTLFNFMGGNLYVTAANEADTLINASNSTTAFVTSPFSVSSAMTPGVCPGLGSENGSATGGTAPYSYQWISTATSSLVSTANPASLAAGYYKVKVTDAGGCFTYLGGLHVTVGLDFVIDSSVGVTPAICPGLGSATVTTTGGGHFTYSWTNSSGTVVGTTDPISLPGGTYHVTVSESSGCSTTQSLFISTTPDFTLTTSSTPATCPATGSATSTVTGGVGPFTYTWTDSYSAVVGTSSSLTGIPATGYYYLSVTDATGCTGTSSVHIVVNSDLTLTHTTTAAICPGLGSATAVITGGTTPFTYEWINSSGTILSTVSPASLPAGNYNLVVTDGVGCTTTDDSVYINLLPDFTATVSVTPATCTNGTATANITGGTSPFSYVWSTGATSASIAGLVPGYYYVTITDALGCVAPMLYGYVIQGITITTTTIVTPTTCIAHSGATTATSYGGTAPYSYLWSNGATTPTITGLDGGSYDVAVTDANSCKGTGYSYVGTIIPISVTPPAVTASTCTGATGTANLSTITGGTPPYSVVWYTTPMQTGYTATGMAPGWYEYEVSDAAGCVKHLNVHIPPMYTIGISFTTTPATCLLADGSILATPSGGTAPYTYVWAGSSATTALLSSVTSGYHNVTVTDVNGCQTTDGRYVPNVSPLTLGLSSVPASCIFAADGSLTATAFSGTPPYNYSMGGSSSGSVTVSSLATNNYFIHVTDASGCTADGYTYVGYNAADSSCYCTVRGTVYQDNNHNCIQDAGEPGISGVQIHCAGFDYTYTDASGNYAIIVPSGSYTVSETLPEWYQLSPCQANNIPYTAVAAAGCSTTIDFADTLTLIHDLSVNTWDYSRPEPGFAYSQITVIRNNGTYVEPTVQARYWTDGTIFAPTFTPSGYYAGSPYVYDATGIPPIVPHGAQSFYMNYFVPASVPLGTILQFEDTVSVAAPLSTWITDTTPWNNVNYFNPYVVGPYDPNFKEVQPKGEGPLGYINQTDSMLQFMVHFQNTGTYLAQNVVVTDTLDPNLDWKTLEPIFMDHNGTVDMDENGRVRFTFKDIDLPPSSSEPFTSNAMFSYSIRTKPGLADGTQIRNRASIYFDYNEPIVTNATLNTISHTAIVNNVAPVAQPSFLLFPNPADKACYATINSDAATSAQLRILDITGKTMFDKTIALQKGKQNITLDVASLSPGMYFVTLYGTGNPQTQKLVILK